MKENRLVPKRRFKEFENDGAWEQRELGEVVNIRSGRDYKHLSEGEIPVYGTGGYMLSVNEALSYKEDAIGIGRKGTIDKPYILRAPFWTVDTLFYAVPEINNDLDFIYNIFQNINWKQKDESTGVPSLSKTAINDIDVLVPDYREQKIVGNFFKNLDYLITLHQHKLKKMKDLKSAYLSEMFPKEGEKYPKRRFAGFTEPWEEQKLGNIGKTFTGLSGKTKEDFGHGDAQFVTYMNIFNNSIANEEQTENVEIDKKQNEVQYGDVFFTTSSETPGEVGMSSVWLGNKSNVYLNSFCFGYRLIEKVNLYYLAYMLRSSEIRKQFQVLAQGISRYNISKTKVMDISVYIPNMEEQQKIGCFFHKLDNLITNHQNKLEKLQNIKKAYLNEMFI